MSNNQIKRKNNKFRTKRFKGGVRNRPTTLGSVDLPHINQKPKQTRCLRYVATSATTQIVVAVADLRGMIGAVTNASTLFIPLIDSFRLKRVGISAVLSGATGAGTVTFAWEGPNVPDIADTSYVGVAVPTTRSYYPPPDTSVGWWYDNGATSVNLFSIQTSAVDSGDTTVFLDIEFEYIIQDGASSTLTLSANASFTGIAYPRLPLTSSSLVPVQLNTVTTV